MLIRSANKTPRVYFYLLLLLVLGLLTGTAVMVANLAFSYPDTLDSALDLDGFSESAIARAILKKRAQSLSLASVADREAYYRIVAQPKICNFTCPIRDPSSDSGGARDEVLLKIRINQWIDQHQAAIQEQKQIWAECHLEHELLLLYKTNGRWAEFIDCYLKLLGATPEHHIVGSWAREALAYSRAFGRTEELLHAFQHQARFNRDPAVADRMQRILERWQLENIMNSSAQD